MGKIFTRYPQFKKKFGISLKNFHQSKVTSGADGDYNDYLKSLRNLLDDEEIKNKKPIEDLMKEKGLNTSIPGFSQVLTGLGVIKKVKGGSYRFVPKRIDKKLSEFIFAYNHYKQKALNDKPHSEELRREFGNFEEKICGKNTYREKSSKKSIIEEEVVTKTEFEIQSTTFAELLIIGNPETKIRRKGWGNDVNIRVSDFTKLDWEIVK